MTDKDTNPANAGIEPAANAEANLETAKEPKQDAASVERLLAESKKYKERAQAAEKELETQRKSNLAEQGKFKELYERSVAEHLEYKKSRTAVDIKSAISLAAQKAGCINVEDLVKLGDASLLQYDEDSGQVHGLELYVQEAKKNKPYLFTQPKGAMINPAVPNGQTQEKTFNVKDVSKLPQEQKNNIWAAALGKHKQ